MRHPLCSSGKEKIATSYRARVLWARSLADVVGPARVPETPLVALDLLRLPVLAVVEVPTRTVLVRLGVPMGTDRTADAGLVLGTAIGGPLTLPRGSGHRVAGCIDRVALGQRRREEAGGDLVALGGNGRSGTTGHQAEHERETEQTTHTYPHASRTRMLPHSQNERASATPQHRAAAEEGTRIHS